MENNRDIAYLQHIKGAIKAIEDFVDSVSYEEFLDDEKTHSAVIRGLLRINKLTQR